MTLTEDTIFLYESIRLKKHYCVIDVCCGEGELLKETAEKYPDSFFTGLDLSADDISERNLTLMRGDLRNFNVLFQPHSFDLFISNPPYFKAQEGLSPDSEERHNERFDDNFDLSIFFSAISYLLKPGRNFFFVFPSARLHEVMNEADRKNMKIFQIRFRHNRPGRASDVCLFMGKNKKGRMDPEIIFPKLNYQEDA
ncbi:methyltransferase domain-containing protein [bacterium]|nr:methyltransferase domain-containing protein [bacterium]